MAAPLSTSVAKLVWLTCRDKCFWKTEQKEPWRLHEVVRMRSLAMAKMDLRLRAAAVSVCGEEEEEDYKEKRMKIDGERGMIRQQEPSGAQWSVDPKVMSVFHITSSFCSTLGSKMIANGLSSAGKCSHYSHGTELLLKTDGTKEWRYGPELKGCSSSVDWIQSLPW